MTHGYGQMRDAGHELKSVLKGLEYAMSASFVVMPGSRQTDSGLPIDYLAFVQCESEELIRDIYPVSGTGVLCLEKPEPNTQPSGWNYTIRPPLPIFEYDGNLVFQIKRSANDDRIIPVSAKPHVGMTQRDIWAFPDTSDLALRRLINCADLIKSLGDDATELRRYVCARDLREKPKAITPFANITEEQEDIVNRLLGRLSRSQQGAFERIHESHHDIVFIQGPPGTGKTTFIVQLLQTLWHCGYSWIACAPSNSATDHLATVLEKPCPEMGAIRFHAYENEVKAIRRQEQALATQDTTEDKKEDNSGAGFGDELVTTYIESYP